MAGPTYKALFHKFRDTTVIGRCEQYAHWTLPYLMADTAMVSANGRVLVERDYQEMGALLLNNLAAKLARILFPTQYPFFKASPSKDFKEYASKKGMSEEQLRAEFARIEVTGNERLFLNAGYASLILALKYLIVTGNVLLHRDSDEGTLCAYGLQSFATRRDGKGKLLDCILREFTTVEALPEELQQILKSKERSKYSRPEQSVEKYTRIHRVIRNGVIGFEVSQQVDTTSTGEASWYPANQCPWMCPTWVIIPGEHYGRGMVEDYAGGFAKLSSLSESSALYAVEIMKVLHLVGAGSGGDIDDLAEAESGEYVRGDPNQVQAHEAGDAAKLVALAGQIEATTLRLAKAFMYQGATRDAERVTMYELQLDAQEAEYTLGGSYSTLSGGVQIPLAYLLMSEVSELVQIGLATGNIKPDVTAGIPALGRSGDVQNLLQASQELAGIYPVIQLDKRIDPQRVTNVVLAGRSIDPTTIFFTPEQQKTNDVAAKAQAAAAANLATAQALGGAGENIQAALGA